MDSLSPPDFSKPSFLPSSSFVITCACLAIDPTTNTVLLTRELSAQRTMATELSMTDGESQAQAACRIPQGPKNIDEGLLSAAVRHTLSETGLRVEPLRIRVPTRAGLGHYGTGGVSVRVGGDGVTVSAHGGDGMVDAGWVVEDLENCEPFAVGEGEDGGVRRIVLYFLAKGSKAAVAVADGAKREAVWAEVKDVEGGVVRVADEELEVVHTAVGLAKRAKVLS